VRDLAALFRTRIELKQIGVRDEAKRLGGIGRCGREYCSASWLPELRPVNLGVAKDQRLSLNPAQISGACGRLMCCLRYEHEFYVQSRKRFPKEAKVLVTARGEEKVVANDIFNERVTLRNVEGETRVVALADLKREMAGGPMTVDEPATEEEPDVMMELDEEVIRMTDTAERPAYRPGLRPGMPGFPERPTQLRRNAPAAPSNREAGEPPKSDVRVNTGEFKLGTVRSGGSGVVEPPSMPPAEGAAEGNATAASDTGETSDAPRPPRRRRGRRGGRRGRARQDGGSLPNAGGADGTPPEGADDGDEDDGDDE